MKRLTDVVVKHFWTVPSVLYRYQRYLRLFHAVHCLRYVGSIPHTLLQKRLDSPIPRFYRYTDGIHLWVFSKIMEYKTQLHSNQSQTSNDSVCVLWSYVTDKSQCFNYFGFSGFQSNGSCRRHSYEFTHPVEIGWHRICRIMSVQMT